MPIDDSFSAFDRTLAAMIDHTLLRADALPQEVDELCRDARVFGFRCVCVQPCFVARAVEALAGAPVGVAAVVGFPHGANTTDTKVFETQRAVADGATEIDVVANLGWIRAGDSAAVCDEVRRVVAAAAAAKHGVVVKVILETALFSVEQKETAAHAAVAGGAAFLKTSTGFHPTGGATAADVALLSRVARTAPREVGVKASGGIKTRAQALALVAAGASRLGASSSIDLVRMADPRP